MNGAVFHLESCQQFTSKWNEDVEDFDGLQVVDVDIRNPEVVDEADVDGHVRVVGRGIRPKEPLLLPPVGCCYSAIGGGINKYHCVRRLIR